MINKFIKEAIQKALDNIDTGGGPFGAVIVKNSKIISSSGNLVTINNDPTAHAEIIAIRKASIELGTWDLSGCEIYCSCEPCPMCMAAIYWAHIPLVYYSATREDAKNAGFDDSFIYEEIALNPDERKIKMHNINRKEALKCFKKWKVLQDKSIY